jgi:hypothetical protein
MPPKTSNPTLLPVGAHVLAIASINDEVIGEICRPADRGQVIHVENGLPLVRFERTGRASIVDPDSEVCRVRGGARARA